MPRKLASDRHRQQQQRAREIGGRELAEREIGSDLEQVEGREIDRVGADQSELGQPLRQHIDLKRRAAGLRQRRGEARHRAPEHAARHARLLGLQALGAEPGIERERHPDEPDHQPHERIRHLGGQRPGDTDADEAARQHHLQVPGAPVTPVDPDRDQVLHDQDRQQDRGRLQRRQDGRQERRRHDPDARKPALAETERRHRDDRERIEQRIRDDVHAEGANRSGWMAASRRRTWGWIKAQPSRPRQS